MRDINFTEWLQGADLVIYQYGSEKCHPGHSFGPAVRDYYLIHYIQSGCGVFRVGKETYSLSAGQGFLITPGIITLYQADLSDPWEYSWVGFQGMKAETYLERAGLSTENPIFCYDNGDLIRQYFGQMLSNKNITRSQENRLLGYLHLLLAELVEAAQITVTPGNQDSYVQHAVEWIAKNYANRLQVNQIANLMGLDRSYLYTLFKKQIGISPQMFLIKFRIEKACELMRNPQLSISNISRSVGYEDPLLFSKIFRRVKGISPREYRKWIVNE